MPVKKHLATITILIKDRQANVEKLNQLLTNYGHLIMARLGVNVERRCVAHCTGLITLAIEATSKEVRDLTTKLNGLYGITAKSSIVTN